MELNGIDMNNTLNGLMNYLKTDVEINTGEIEQKQHLKVIGKKPGYIIEIKISNTAPIELRWPMVVFTGVNLVNEPKLTGGTGVQAWMNHHHFKVDASKAYPQAQPSFLTESFSKLQPLKIGCPAFPILTSDEMAHGYALFPGQFIVYEIGVLGENKPDIKDLNFWVEGSLSRRHLLHSMKQIV
jgi:hypothetical protein